jgi:hypothetical protein
MTNREFYQEVINANINDELTDFATAGLEKLDHTNSLRKEATAKKAQEREVAERAPIREAIMAVMTIEPKTATTLIAESGVEIKPQAIPSLLKGLVEDGTIVKSDVKFTGKGKQRGYALAE